MFRTRSDYIKAKDSSYTDIRNQLHRAYQKKGANARIRFVEGRGLYIKNEKADWRKSFDSDDEKKARQAKFDGAKESLIAAIDREYDCWKVNDQSTGQVQKLSMGQYVVNNLTMPSDGDGLDENALKQIDALIEEGMKSAAADLEQEAQDNSPRRISAAKEARGRIQEMRDRKAIFEDLKSARNDEASRSGLQRWWAKHFGDNQVQTDLNRAFDRARNWRAIVHGNQLLCDAIEEDLAASGYRGDRQAEARKIINDEGLLYSGLTPKSHNAVMRSLASHGCSTENVSALGAYVDLTQNAKTNVNRLHRLNSSIDHILKRMNFGDANNTIREALNTSEAALSEAVKDLNSRRLSDEYHRNHLYQPLQDSFRLLCDARCALIGVETKQNAQALDRLTGFIDEHLVVTHDLARSILDVGQAEFDEHDEDFRLPIKEGVNLVAGFSADALVEGLPQPKTIFQSTARKMNGDAMPEATYNEACRKVSNALNRYKRALSGSHIDDQLKYLGKLRRRVAEASRLNDQLVIGFGRQSVLGGSAHTAVTNHLQDQRADLLMLKLNCVQEQVRLENKRLRAGRESDLSPLESDSNSSGSNLHTQKFVSPRPGLGGVYRRDSSNDEIDDGSSNGAFSGARGNESLLSFGDSNNSASPSVDEQQRDRDFPFNAAPAMSRRTVAAPALDKAGGNDSDGSSGAKTVAVYVGYPEDVESFSGGVQSPGGGVSVVSWDLTKSPTRSDTSPPQHIKEPEFGDAGFQGINGQLPVFHGHLSHAAFHLPLTRPLSGLPEEPVDQYARRSAFADQPQFTRTVSSETLNEPRPGLIPQTSQVSYVSNAGSVSTNDSFAQMELNLNTEIVSTLKNNSSGVDENEESSRDNYDAGHLLGADVKDNGLTFFQYESDYAGADKNENNESASPTESVVNSPERGNKRSSNTGLDSNLAKYGSSNSNDTGRGSGSSSVD